MNKSYKKLVTDINRKSDLDNDLVAYFDGMLSEYNFFSMLKTCLNYYTLKEEYLDYEAKDDDASALFVELTDIIKSSVTSNEKNATDMISAVIGIRENIERKMKVLTSFVDLTEVYEYVLNRKEYGFKGETKEFDNEEFANRIYNFVFSNQDTVVVNSNLQFMISQLPLRMTKNKFFDIISSTLNIYKGGDTYALDDFAERVEMAVGAVLPEAFDTEYPEIYESYKILSTADYKNLDAAKFEELSTVLDQMVSVIRSKTSFLVLLAEVTNEILSILLSDAGRETNSSVDAYNTAIKILKVAAESETLDIESLFSDFEKIEGVGEDAYENIMVLEAILDSVSTMTEIAKLSLSDKCAIVNKISKLTGGSLFVPLDSEEYVSTELTEEYIEKTRARLVDEFTKLFVDMQKPVVRSIMAKTLATMPIFLNTSDEVKNYIDQSISLCTDASELSCAYEVIMDYIEEAELDNSY